jgi:hypothetical protein
VRAGDLALGVELEALHRRDRTFERLHHLEHLDLAGGAAQAITAVRAALALDEPGLAQLGDEVLEVRERQALGLGDGAQRHRGAVLMTAELDHQAHSVFRSGGKQHRQEILAEWSVMPGATLAGWNRPSDCLAT